MKRRQREQSGAVFYVSRQRYVYSGENVVEVTSGGSDYAGADALVPKYRGEGKKYSDPREAVAAAIEICKAWRRDWAKMPHSSRGPQPQVAYGATGGMGLELEPDTFESIKKRADATAAKLEKCDRCGEILGRKVYRNPASDWTGFRFCSENCAERAQEDDDHEE